MEAEVGQKVSITSGEPEDISYFTATVLILEKNPVTYFGMEPTHEYLGKVLSITGYKNSINHLSNTLYIYETDITEIL